MTGLLEKYAKDDDVRQLLLVEWCDGSNAVVRYYVKGPKGWRLRGRCDAYVGKNGVGKTREGDARTPLGELKAIRAFGILPDPGCALPFLRVTPGTVAVDEEGPYYNRIVQAGEVCGEQGGAGGPGAPDSCPAALPGGERMWELSPEYDYGLETDYNAAGIWPLGSAIFIHCKGSKAWTGGCVALDKSLMKKILRTADSGLRIIVSKLGLPEPAKTDGGPKGRASASCKSVCPRHCIRSASSWPSAL